MKEAEKQFVMGRHPHSENLVTSLETDANTGSEDVPVPL